MIKSFKKIILVLIVSFFICTLTACNNDTDKDIWTSSVGNVSVDFENVGWNVMQKTFVVTGADSGTEIKKKYKTSIKKMRDFLDYINSLEYAKTSTLSVGDGITISVLNK